MRKILLTTLIAGVAIWISAVVFAQKKSAIGVRVMANNEHLPIAIWYEAQNFLKQGNPSYTQVDGYDALRDGRTVYANAINVICPQVENSVFCLAGAPPSGTDKCAYAIDCADASDKTEYPNFYTNVYVISVSDEDAEAQDMFSQILKNWHFNTNINVNNMCAYASDIPMCKTAIGGEKGVAELQTKLRRDGRRISDVVFMQAVLENYKNAQGHYPTLKSGTYLENQTISKWPSWNETLGQELGTAVPSDPVNNFGVCGADNPDCYCEGYDANTCWDNKSRLFNGTRDVKSGMPQSALVYYYKSLSNGASYQFNASRWETSYIGGESVAKMQAAHSASNTKPAIARISAVKMSPNETKIVEAQALDYNQFTEKIIWADTVLVGTTKDAKKLCSALASDEQCCIAAAVLEPNTKNADKFDGSKFVSYKNLKITAGANICKGKINLKVSDDGIKNADNSALESDVYVVEADVRNQPPAFPSGIKTYSAETVVGFNWEYSVQALDAEDKNLTYKILSAPSWLSFEGGGAEKMSSSGVKISGTVNVAGVYNFSIETKDSKGGIAALAIALTVTNKNPVITDFPVDAEKHITENFSYQVKASDADGHKLKYSIVCKTGVNCGITLNIDSAGKITSPRNFAISDFGGNEFTVTVSDDYGGSASKSFKIIIAPFCGNGVVENWSASKVDAWMEQCESAGNGTSANDQYECTSCKWNDSGWCGDGTPQNGQNGTVDKEICDKSEAAKACATTFTEGIPAYCSGIPLTGTQKCNDSCTGWGVCEAKPVEIGGTSTGCNSSNADLRDAEKDGYGKLTGVVGYACCELVSCINDGCGCCGEFNKFGNSPKDDREDGALVTKNYVTVDDMNPCTGAECQCFANLNLCKECAGCNQAPDCSQYNSKYTKKYCKLNQYNKDPRFWEVTTNHTTAKYRCWR